MILQKKNRLKKALKKPCLYRALFLIYLLSLYTKYLYSLFLSITKKYKHVKIEYISSYLYTIHYFLYYT